MIPCVWLSIFDIAVSDKSLIDFIFML